MAAKKKEIRKLAPEVAPASGQRIVGLYVPEKAKQTHFIAGSAPEAARELVRILREDARVF